MTNSDRFTPRYFQIEQVLRARIADLEVGDPIPSDTELSKDFGVSRMTVRQAFQALVQEGLVERRPGSGTYVADTSSHRQATVLIGFTDETRRKGRVPSSRLIDSGVRAASDDEAVVLGLAEGDDVVFLHRLRLADGTPIALEAAVLAGRCRAVVDHDLEDGSLHRALRSEGFAPAQGRASILAASARPEEAELLDVGVGDPLLVERRLIYEADGTPIEFTESRYAAGRYELDVDFVVEAG